MKIVEKQLIKNWILNKITKEEFLLKYPIDLINNDKYILSTLQTSYENQEAEEMEYALMLLPLDNFTESEKYVDVLSRLILAGWHNRHEDIAALLTGIKSPKSVPALYQAANAHYDYLDYDDTYQLARKCIKALSAINNAEAINKLQFLANHSIKEIQEYAKNELYIKGLL